MIDQRTTRPARPLHGFTLVELLVVTAIIALLLGLVLPGLGRARSVSKRVVCLSNLRQMHLASVMYRDGHRGRFAVAYWFDAGASYTWEITTLADGTHEPGLLWSGQGSLKIQQCPSFDGPDAWTNAPFTGYNYNTSYLGRGQWEDIPEPACISDVVTPTTCAEFGDGGFAGGANKFMRSPQPAPGDAGFAQRHAGAQAFRHLDATNAMFVDGHGETLATSHDAGHPGVAEGTGFLSEDNQMYATD